MNNPHDTMLEFSIRPAFSPRRCQFTYSGTVSETGIKDLCEQIDLALTLYQPSVVAVQFCSPGGSARALDYWLYRLMTWRKVGVEVETMADVVCASAAALSLAFGTVGRRFVHPLSRLHFHNPRVMTPKATELQEHEAEEVARVLQASRIRMQHLIRDHLIGSIGVHGFVRTLWSRAQWLLQESRNDYLSGLQPDGYKTEDESDSRRAIQKWSTQIEDGVHCTDEVVQAWERQVADLFSQDRVVELRHAWALLLFDSSDQLPPLIERLATDSKIESEALGSPALLRRNLSPSTSV